MGKESEEKEDTNRKTQGKPEYSKFKEALAPDDNFDTLRLKSSDSFDDH